MNACGQMDLNISLWVCYHSLLVSVDDTLSLLHSLPLFLNPVRMKDTSLTSGKYTQIKKKKNKILLLNRIPEYLLSAVSTSL